MTYGTIKVDTVTFTNAGVDKSVTLSGLVQNPVFSGNVTVTGTLSGVTVTGATANFTSGNFTNISGGTHTITSGVFAAGSAASPSITFTGDLNTGIYSPGADQVAISTGGSGRLFVDANGNIYQSGSSADPFSRFDDRQFAINASSAAQNVALSINAGSTAGRGGQVYLGQGGTRHLTLAGNNSESTIGTASNTPLRFETNASERLRITSAGLVGVGTSSPAQILHCTTTNGTASQLQFTQQFQREYRIGVPASSTSFEVYDVSAGASRLTIDSSGRVGVGTTSPGQTLSLANATAPTLGFLRGSTLDMLLSSEAAGAAIQTYNNTPIQFSVVSGSSGFSERVRIDSSGRVGIGTSSPSGLLTLAWNSSTGINAGLIGQVNNSAGANNGYRIGLRTSSDATNWCSIDQAFDNLGGSANTYIAFTTTSGYTPAERMRLTGTGLGIGTTSIPETLSVKGNTITGSTVEVAYGWQHSGGTGLQINGNNGTLRPTLTLWHLYGSDSNAGQIVFKGLSSGGNTLNNASIYATQTGTTTGSGSGELVFATGNALSERARIDSSGRLLVGTSSARTGFVIPNVGAAIQLEGAGGDFTNQYRSISLTHNINDAPGPNIFLTKTRSSSTGGTSVVASGDELGNVWFCGADGTRLPAGASISAFVDGTPGANDMPGRLVFSTTADGASSPTERMRIAANGQITHSLNGTTNAPNLTLSVGGVGDPGNSTWITPRIDFVGSALASPATTFIGATGAYGSRSLVFATGSDAAGSERARIDSSGRLLVGTSSARSNYFNQAGIIPAFQVVGNTHSASSALLHNTAANSVGPYFHFGKSRGTAYEIVSNNDYLGLISFQGADGSTMFEAASIIAQVDGTPGANDMPGRLVFSTTADGASSPTERMRIKSNGFSEFTNDGTITGGTVHVFRSNINETTLQVRNSNTSLATSIFRVIATRNTSNNTYYFINCVIDGVVNVFYVADSGNVTNTNNSYGAISDVKLKENIVDATSQWSDIRALRVRKYNFKEGQTHTQIGLVAQEVELVSPGLVSESPDRDAEGNDLGTVTKSVNYSVLYMKAVKALQEAMERIETLEAKVAALESA